MERAVVLKNTVTALSVLKSLQERVRPRRLHGRKIAVGDRAYTPDIIRGALSMPYDDETQLLRTFCIMNLLGKDRVLVKPEVDEEREIEHRNCATYQCFKNTKFEERSTYRQERNKIPNWDIEDSEKTVT